VTRRFICVKSRITPLKKITIPRLELLSALLLSRVITTVQEALKPELEIIATDCYTDSQVALCWIRGTHREWKQFVHNRVMEIQSACTSSFLEALSRDTKPCGHPVKGSHQYRDASESRVMAPWTE